MDARYGLTYFGCLSSAEMVGATLNAGFLHCGHKNEPAYFLSLTSSTANGF